MSDNDTWYEEFEAFAGDDSSNALESASSPVRKHLLDLLNPSPQKVFGQLMGLHCIVGALTLFLCPQLGIGPFGSRAGLMRLFGRFGELACTAACSAFFVGTSIIVASIILKPEVLRVIRAHKWLQIFALSGLSLGTLVCLGGTLVSWTVAMAWILGGSTLAPMLLELGWRARMRYSA